jgi:hypothetical protein
MEKNYCEITCVTRKHPSGKSGDRPANQLIGIQPLPKNIPLPTSPHGSPSVRQISVAVLLPMQL